ncbi:MAG: universal stress protein [Hyphomicrobiaceae bacterium]
MTYKTILVHFESEAQIKGVLDYVIALARAHGAHVIGVAVLPSYYKVPASEVGTTALIEDVRDQFRATTAAAMRAAFEKALGQETFGSEWRLIDPGFRATIESVADLGNAADLIVVRQELHGEHDEGYRDGLGLLAVLTGRPVLLLPHKEIPAAPPQTVVVAWDGSQKAARAVFDALPLLQNAARVTLIAVRERDALGGTGSDIRRQQGNDLRDALLRHGVEAAVPVELLFEDDVAQSLLAGATARHADLLVLGGYGHSRLREWVFGGVTRSVLRHMTTPVLLSH